MLEDAIEHDTPVHISSWDITRAFDSVSKNIMRLAWSRLGIPDEWLEWLVAMDVQGLTVVRTPHAVQLWDKHGTDKFVKRPKLDDRPTGFEEFICPGMESKHKAMEEQAEPVRSTNDTAEGFSAERGTGQGDVSSPACWSAVFDILLTALALDAQDRENRWIRGKSNVGYVSCSGDGICRRSPIVR